MLMIWAWPKIISGGKVSLALVWFTTSIANNVSNQTAGGRPPLEERATGATFQRHTVEVVWRSTFLALGSDTVKALSLTVVGVYHQTATQFCTNNNSSSSHSLQFQVLLGAIKEFKVRSSNSNLVVEAFDCSTLDLDLSSPWQKLILRASLKL